MYHNVQRQSRFDRTLSNEAKLGAYYTDLEHCRRIGQLFDFKVEEEYCVIEPSIGNGRAVMEVTGKDTKDSNIKIFGVELNTDTVESLKGNEYINYLLEADFLNGTNISPKSFSFSFANPPYGTNDKDERYEQLFLEKLYSPLKPNAVLAYVIPYYVLKEKKFATSYIARFKPLQIYRFDDEEYAKFKQIVLIGTRRNYQGYFRQELDSFINMFRELGDIPYLPQMGEKCEKIFIPSSQEEEIEYFTQKVFDFEGAFSKLEKSNIYKLVGDKFKTPNFQAQALGRPPVPLKKDLLYLLAVSGGGQGITGSEKTNDLHLQRGVAKVVESSEYVMNESGSSMYENVKSYTQIQLNIIENDGKITTLE